MRVIAGEAKGHRLQGPPSALTRPMADKIREALFSSLLSLGVEPKRILDLYAGTGAVGIEALSRGGAWCTFVDQQAAACAVIRKNLDHTKLTSRAEVINRPVDRALASLGGHYDLIILDPPYADPDIGIRLAQIGDSPLVQSDAIVVLGHWPKFPHDEWFGAVNLIKRRCHGDSCFSIFQVDREGLSSEPASSGSTPGG